MGGRSSRPAEMSARAVLARRRLDESSLPVHPGVNHNNNNNNIEGGDQSQLEGSTTAAVSNRPAARSSTEAQGAKIDLDINPSLLNSLSKMSMITSKNESVKIFLFLFCN